MKTRGSALKALTILEVMSKGTAYFGINQLCDATELSQGTVHRILGELVEANYIEKHTGIRKYRIGTEALSLASRLMGSANLIADSKADLERLRDSCLETVHLFGLTGTEVIYLSKVQTKHPIGLLSTVGKTAPVYCTSGGKAIAAYMPQEWVDWYLQTVTLERCTDYTITSRDAFVEELGRIRDKGYALDNAEHHDNITCIGAPVLDRNGRPVASISVAAPRARLSLEGAIALAPEVMTCARQVAAKLTV